MSEKTSATGEWADDTGEVIGAEFTGVIHAAQQGRVAGFARLWADVHPALVRYLRVVSVADADDVACESWVTVVRRLRSFEGDETAWRSLVFSAARMHAEDENQRRVWDAMVESDETAAIVATVQPPGEEPYEDDEVEGGPAHGLRMAIEAIRDLPPEQGEVLMLRVLGRLPEASVAEVVGTDVATVHLAEQQALDQLGVDAELVSWALGADPRPVELADEAAVLSIYRNAVPELVPTTRSLRSGQPAAEAVAASGVRVIALPKPTWRTRAGVSAAATVAIVGLGTLSAAAFQGVLPDPVQNVMALVIGAPSADEVAASPTPTRAGTSAGNRGGAVGPTLQTRAPRPAGAAATSAAVGLCRSWEADRGRQVTQEESPAFRSLVAAAGGKGRVTAYCTAAEARAAKPTTMPPSAHPTATKPTATAKTTKAPETTTAEPSTSTTTKTKKTKPAKPTRTTTTTPAPDDVPPSATSTTEVPPATDAPETQGGGAQDSREGRGTPAPAAGDTAGGRARR